MAHRHVAIIGGGLAGLSAGCYALQSGYRVTIVEHNLALGGVCTAWPRGPYIVDGCIHWLTGGAFSRIYEELEIIPPVALRTIERFVTYRDATTGLAVDITRDLDALGRVLRELAPDDGAEIERLIAASRAFTSVDPGVDAPPELSTLREGILRMWGMRHEIGDLVHFRKPFETYLREHVKSERLGRVLSALAPPAAPALVLLMMLGYLERGWLSRPVGGTAAFRDALIGRYEALGGEVKTHATVDEIIVENDRACGVRLGDGSRIDADVVISTSSTPETQLRLLGGRYGADELRRRLAHWKLFDPIVLASYGVAMPMSGLTSMQLVDGIEPFDVGGRAASQMYVRLQNDAPELAPSGHTVVQVMLATDYDWWARQGLRYRQEKERTGERVLEQLDRHFPGVREAVRMTDVATPLTYWNATRSWRGAYEGWMPSSDSFFGHVKKTLPGLGGMYMAGQWVEPGGGVPTAVMSGRQVVQLLCADEERVFVAHGPGLVLDV